MFSQQKKIFTLFEKVLEIIVFVFLNLELKNYYLNQLILTSQMTETKSNSALSREWALKNHGQTSSDWAPRVFLPFSLGAHF